MVDRCEHTATSSWFKVLLHFRKQWLHSFGYDSERRSNLMLLDDRTLVFIAGNLLVLLQVHTKEQRYLRSCSGEGIGAITAHPSNEYFVIAEKGNQPLILVYEYPSLRLYHILRGGTEQVYSSVDFNLDGSILASVGGAPDYMLTLWDWRHEEVMLRCKASSQEVYRVRFSPHNPELLTSSGTGHVKFWTISPTFTGLKLQGVMGYFGETSATDVEGFVELPDRKVVTGTEWGNLLLWDREAIKVEICRIERQSCHVGTAQPFSLEDGLLMTFGSDGVIRGWDIEKINMADTHSGRLEMEPINELVVGHNVCLSSVVRSPLPNSFIWFAQDSNGAIWKLDLSFTNTTPDPECLFTFHAGSIHGLDVCKTSHLMATTAPDRSVKVFDFLAKKQLTTSCFNQSGTTISWAPPWVKASSGLLGFEDGVVRLLELYRPQSLYAVSRSSCEEDGKLRLKQAFKPHSESVTALAYERNGEILATGSADGTVFFFSVGEKYLPIGFIHVPSPVQALEWSPASHSNNRLLILCWSGHVVEVNCPNPKDQEPLKTFLLPELHRRPFRFQSIKSRIKRQEDILRLQALKEEKKKKAKELLTLLDAKQEEDEEEEEEKEEELPPIYIPDPPSPLYCGFYSEPDHFWLSMGGFDSGYLYHCKFSENQDEEPEKRKDEPFHFLPIHNADNDPICSITFSSSRELLLCGMHSGSIRVYPLQPGDLSLTSMQSYWVLSLHDNQNGQLHHIRCSHDDLFVLTAGDDGNIFSFTRRPPEELQSSLQRKAAMIPSPSVSFLCSNNHQCFPQRSSPMSDCLSCNIRPIVLKVVLQQVSKGGSREQVTGSGH
ncbi:cilia- and flagella-associated protein 44-like isoform X4 [Gouania willdenowi]|uniref:cilia- and flagella-associated protein 44-like isoform X4 n=1 Tax=Gouania willdenowi TaxID=441366 RepID=UPI0010546B65|nr:cilia- and flagella-associated protein 44-like isoform X4 [Gouania willdenowi]